MPYVDQASRSRREPIVDAAAQSLPRDVTAGELNYLFTRLALEFVRRRGVSACGGRRPCPTAGGPAAAAAARSSSSAWSRRGVTRPVRGCGGAP